MPSAFVPEPKNKGPVDASAVPSPFGGNNEVLLIIATNKLLCGTHVSRIPPVIAMASASATSGGFGGSESSKRLAIAC